MSSFERAAAAIEAVHDRDPSREADDSGAMVSTESLYARRMGRWLDRLAPEADEVLKLAVRCQHLERWEKTRDSYPEGRKGYLQWRQSRARRAASIAEEILRDAGYEAEDVARIAKLVQKKGLMRDPEVQMLEDAACLVFLEHYFVPFQQKHPDEKIIDVVGKTWRKMSPAAQRRALDLELDARTRDLVGRALQSEPGD